MKKRKTRAASLVLALAMTTGLLAGCSQSSGGSSDATTDAATHRMVPAVSR